MQERLARALRWLWGAGASTAVSVTGATGSRPQDAVIFSAPGRRRASWVAPAAGGLAMRRRGPVCRGAPAPAGYGNRAALQITALVAGAEEAAAVVVA